MLVHIGIETIFLNLIRLHFYYINSFVFSVMGKRVAYRRVTFSSRYLILKKNLSLFSYTFPCFTFSFKVFSTCTYVLLKVRPPQK